MSQIANCNACDICDVLIDLDLSLINIADKALYNARYGLNANVDFYKYRLLKFYKTIATNICNNNDCGCYTTGVTQVSNCQAIGPICTQNSCINGCICDHRENNNPILPTEQNITERIKILILQ